MWQRVVKTSQDWMSKSGTTGNLRAKQGYKIEYFTPAPVVDASRIETLIAPFRPKNVGHDLVRIGSKFDGGYLVPNDIDGIAACFSPGVADDSAFELQLAERGISCFMADASVSAPSVAHPQFDFEKKFLGGKDKGKRITLNSWVSSKFPDNTKDLILQMDIEGAEYATLAAAPAELLSRFRIMIIEFHGLHRLIHPGFSGAWLDMTNKLLQSFEVAHIHVNNCCPVLAIEEYELPHVMEFTFLRKDRVKTSNRKLQFPHPLDAPNLEDRLDIQLPFCWQQKPYISPVKGALQLLSKRLPFIK